MFENIITLFIISISVIFTEILVCGLEERPIFINKDGLCHTKRIRMEKWLSDTYHEKLRQWECFESRGHKTEHIFIERK